ncbi:MAG: DUF3592 domain-containing protein [Firmicutes bacterium]|nr:DUF3592 domain-containing protein [[Eubacterium] siraeum]MCM1487739.1 DUF3592 domain-containing protein [Bacillota bacterium]
MTGRSKRIIAQNNLAEGTITDINRCWWFKINTKPVRTDSMDGAVFPNIISFSYKVNGCEYNGKKFIGINTRRLQKGDKITVYYDGDKPCRYALSDSVFGRELY